MKKQDLVEQAREKVIDLIDNLTDSKKMSKSQYKDLMEELRIDIQCRIDAVSEEEAGLEDGDVNEEI